MSKNPSRAKICATLLLIITVAGTFSFFGYVSTIICSEEPKLTVTYDFSEYTVNRLIVWKMSEELTAINRTSETWCVFYEVCSNSSGNEVQRNIVYVGIINSTNNLVFGTYSASYVIQWAINNGNIITVDAGNYNITSALNINCSNLSLDAYGSVFRVTSNFTGNFVIEARNCSHLSIRGLNIDATGWNPQSSDYVVGINIGGS